jgi:hypothetical protein
MNAPPTDLEMLKLYREEVRHEFNLLAMRTTILITCQSFLIVPFAILNTAQDFRLVCLPVFSIAVLGACVAWTLKKPMDAADTMISEWLTRQRLLLKGSEELRPMSTERDALEVNLDSDHQKSLAFSRRAVYFFLTFWVLVFLGALFRTCLAFINNPTPLLHSY